MPQTPAQLKAAREHAKRKTAEGWRKSTFWLHPDSVATLEKLREVHGTRDAVINFALMAAAGYTATRTPPGPKPWQPPAKPVSTPEKPPSVDVPLMERRAFNPQPKKGAKK